MIAPVDYWKEQAKRRAGAKDETRTDSAGSEERGLG